MARAPMPRLVLELLDNHATNFGPTTVVDLIPEAVKVGWAQWSRFPPSAFFSLRKNSVYNELITAGLSHLRIWYINEATGYAPSEPVFQGRIGDADETADDVVWRAHGYLAEFALSRTGYRVMYGGKKISTIVTREWSRDASKGKFKDYGATKQVRGLSRHVATGTIQNPLNVNSGGMRVDSQFGVIDVPRLLLFYDLTEIGRANTTNNVTFEVSRSLPATFNFWRNRGSAVPGRPLTFPGLIRNYRFVRGVTDIRNDLASIGTRRGQAREIKADRETGTYGWDTFGRRQDTFPIQTLSGFKNLNTDNQKFSAQKMIVQRAVKEATRPTRSLRLDIPTEEFEPFDGWEIEDTFPLRIKDTPTLINTDYRMVGVNGRMDGDGYHQTLYVVTDVT